jgi:hypothetical protein
MLSIHVGTPPENWFGPWEWEDKTIYFHNFLGLPSVRSNDNFITSPRFRCFGCDWELKLYPGGEESEDGSDSYNQWATIYLCNCSGAPVTISWRMELGGGDGYGSSSPRTFSESFDEVGCRSSRRSIWRDNFLLNRPLIVKLSMKLCPKTHGKITVPRPSNCNYMDIFLDNETANIKFVVKGANVVAHKCIIKSQAKELYVMCESYSEAKTMMITDVEWEIFEMMLRTLYGGPISPHEWQKNSEAILAASSKYGFVNLKLEAEVWYAKSLQLTVDNVIDEFLKADGNNCAKVRAAAKEFMAENGEEIVASESFDKLRESLPLMREVMTAIIQRSKKRKRS